MHRLFVVITLALLLAQPLAAQQLSLTVELPRLKVAEYHRPYLAVWLQDGENHVTNLAVLYDMTLENREGEKWLKDMRLWWRRSGRSLSLPLDGVTGATRAPGVHILEFTLNEPPLQNLKTGSYTLLVEAAREVGGREVVEVPFHWPPTASKTHTAAGERELGQVELKLQNSN